MATFSALPLGRIFEEILVSASAAHASEFKTSIQTYLFFKACLPNCKMYVNCPILGIHLTFSFLSIDWFLTRLDYLIFEMLYRLKDIIFN